MRLLDYFGNTHSQTGEDGILSKVLEVLPANDKWCVEFGAWDGQHLSNTCKLVEDHDYSAVLIEADKKRFIDLKAKFEQNARITALNAFVGFTVTDSLDILLKASPIPKDFDLLSIDIDGNDYHVWNAVSTYEPKVVCIEYNPTIPNEVEFVQPANPSIQQGASLLALTKLGKRKGYELVAVTSLNAIFVRSEFFPLFKISNNEPRTLREDVSAITYIFSGQDGTILFAGGNFLPWHSVHSRITYSSRIRQLPKIFREYPENFGPLRSSLYKIYSMLCQVIRRG
jgi:hypothetical protein